MRLFYNPISSYSQKVLMALYEKGVDFVHEVVDLMNPDAHEEYVRRYRMGRVPLLVTDDDDAIPESTSIIEWLEEHFPTRGTKLIPTDPRLARQVRTRDRFADFYLNDAMQKVFFDGLRPEGERDRLGVDKARRTLDSAYATLDTWLAEHHGPFMVGEAFTMADCAAAPALDYLRKVHPFDDHVLVMAYAARLSDRRSYARVRAEAKPIFDKLFPSSG